MWFHTPKHRNRETAIPTGSPFAILKVCLSCDVEKISECNWPIQTLKLIKSAFATVLVWHLLSPLRTNKTMKHTYRKESVRTDTKALTEVHFTWQQFLCKSGMTAIAEAPKPLFWIVTASGQWRSNSKQRQEQHMTGAPLRSLHAWTDNTFLAEPNDRHWRGSFHSHGVKLCMCFTIFRIVTPIWTERTKQQFMYFCSKFKCLCFFFRPWMCMLLVLHVLLEQRVAASCTTTKWLPSLC